MSFKDTKGIVTNTFRSLPVNIVYRAVTSDDVASRLQVSDLYKSDLQVSSRFANDLM